MFKRVIGATTVIGALLGLLLSVAGVLYGYDFIDRTYADWDTTLTASVSSMRAIGDTVQQTDVVIRETVKGLGQINTTLRGLSVTFDTTEPIIATFQQIAVNDVPDSIDVAVQGLDAAIGVLRTVDNTLENLSDIQIDLPGPLPTIAIGIPYNPETPIYAPFETVSTNLGSATDALRSIDSLLTETRTSVTTISQDVVQVSASVGTVQRNLQNVQPSLVAFDDSVQNLISRLERTQANITRNRDWTRLIVTGVLLWLALTQIGMLYWGGTLLLNRQEKPA